MNPKRPLSLRIELLRMRAAIERAELTAAVHELDAGTRPVRALARGLFGAVQGLEKTRPGAASLLATALAMIRERPWLASAVSAVLSSRRGRRLILLAGVAAAVGLAVRTIAAKAGGGTQGTAPPAAAADQPARGFEDQAGLRDRTP